MLKFTKNVESPVDVQPDNETNSDEEAEMQDVEKSESGVDGSEQPVPSSVVSPVEAQDVIDFVKS